MGKWKHMTEKDFAMIKALLDAGLTINKVAKTSGRAFITVKAVNEADSLAGYKEYMQRYSESKKVSKAVIEQPQMVLADTEVDLKPVVTSQEQTLERIAVALEALVEAWQNTPNKKGWLK